MVIGVEFGDPVFPVGSSVGRLGQERDEGRRAGDEPRKVPDGSEHSGGVRRVRNRSDPEGPGSGRPHSGEGRRLVIESSEDWVIGPAKGIGCSLWPPWWLNGFPTDPPNPSNSSEYSEPFELSATARSAGTTVGTMDPAPTSSTSTSPADAVRRGPAGEDELYLDEILSLTPIKRTRLYTFRDQGRFGPVREAPGPTCPRPVFLLEGVAGVCEELGYPIPSVADILAFRSAGVARASGDDIVETAWQDSSEKASPETNVHPARARVSGLESVPGTAQRHTELELEQRGDMPRARDPGRGPGAPSEDPNRQAIEAALHEERARQLEEEHEALRAERDRARAEEAAGRERVITLEADLRITDAARERALEDLVARDSRIRRLDSDLEERTAEAHRLNAEHRGVQGDLRQAVAERDAARGERNDLRGDRDALREDVSDAREENAALRPEVELLRANTTRGFRRRQRRQAKRDSKPGVDTASADEDEASSTDESA